MVLSGNWLSPQIYGHFGLINLPWCTGSCPSHTAFRLYRFCLTSPCRLLRGCNDHTSCLVYPPDYENNVVAVWSGIMLATSLEFWIISHAIITDSMLMLFTVPTLLSAYIGLMETTGATWSSPTFLRVWHAFPKVLSVLSFRECFC